MSKEIQNKITKLANLYGDLARVNQELAYNLLDLDLTTLEIMVQRNVSNRYGNSYATLGLQGILFQIFHKVARLKNNVTDGKNFIYTEDEMIEFNSIGLKDDGIQAHLFDIINYAKLAVIYILRKINNAKK